MYKMQSFLLIFFALTVVSCNVHFTEEKELYEGSDCTLEDDSDAYAKCRKMTECADKLQRIAKGELHFPPSEHCGYANFTPIVCCRPRVAEDGCEQFTEDDVFRTVVFEGTPAKQNEFRFMVALGYVNDDFDSATVPTKYRCGGTLISNQHVLTAAHCVNNIQNLVPIVARMGNVDLTTVTNHTQEIAIESITTHPKYRRSRNYHDIAIVKLKTRVDRTTGAVRPICLYISNLLDSLPTKDDSYLVLGWGLTSYDSDGSPKLIKSPDLSFVDQKTCASSYVGFSKLPNGLDQNMICIRDLNDTRRADACQGDSGGPLLMKQSGLEILVGITAFGRGCATQHPAVYISIFHYLEWIEEVVWNSKVSQSTPISEKVSLSQNTPITQKVSENTPIPQKVSQNPQISQNMSQFTRISSSTWSGYYYRK